MRVPRAAVGRARRKKKRGYNGSPQRAVESSHLRCKVRRPFPALSCVFLGTATEMYARRQLSFGGLRWHYRLRRHYRRYRVHLYLAFFTPLPHFLLQDMGATC